MLYLPSVTLVMQETREHELAALAVKDCIDQVKFGEILILTNDAKRFVARCPKLDVMENVTFWHVRDWEDKLGWCKASWFTVPPLLKTKHALLIQWDSWVCDPTMWRDEYLDYDYVGAPWWYKDGKNVGNSGFALVSTALKRYIYDRRGNFPCTSTAEDDLLCRTYRPQLEDAGFRWAPEWVAHNFAFECCRPSPTSRHFGFHAAFNFPDVLDRSRLTERVRLMCKSPYINRNYMMKALAQKHMGLLKDILTEISADAVHA